MPFKRGEIHNRERAKQLRDFSGLLYGNITATDLDGLIEYKNKGYVFIETKLQGTLLDFGQKLALERITDDLTRSNKPAICIVSDHNINDPTRDIDVAKTIVREYRLRGRWNTPHNSYTTKQMVDWFINNVLIQKIKSKSKNECENTNAK